MTFHWLVRRGLRDLGCAMLGVSIYFQAWGVNQFFSANTLACQSTGLDHTSPNPNAARRLTRQVNLAPVFAG